MGNFYIWCSKKKYPIRIFIIGWIKFSKRVFELNTKNYYIHVISKINQHFKAIFAKLLSEKAPGSKIYGKNSLNFLIKLAKRSSFYTSLAVITSFGNIDEPITF